jgi:cysteinyl-tRNA synthetase
MALKVYNTLTRKLDVFEPVKKGQVGMYTCGPTVYDFAHIGNFRAYICADIIRRYFDYKGYKVKQVMNITDVEDKIIRNAGDKGVTIQEYTEPYTKAFFEDLKKLNIKPADLYPKATEYIKEMVDIVKKLKAKGYTYEKDDSTYYRISKFKDYGKLSKVNIEESKEGVRIDADEYDKESAHDFVLWKARKGNEPFWETELGNGRPGWHIECSAMSMKNLGETFDIHTGGIDLIFPHHEN